MDYLFFGLSFGDVVPSDFDARFEEGFGHLGHVHTEQVGDLLRHRVIGQRGLVRITLLLELHVAEEQRGRYDAEDGRQVFGVHAHNRHGFTRLLEFGHVVHAVDGQRAVRQEGIEFGILQNVFLCSKQKKSLVSMSNKCLLII